jgi:hypothetical protein
LFQHASVFAREVGVFLASGLPLRAFDQKIRYELPRISDLCSRGGVKDTPATTKTTTTTTTTTTITPTTTIITTTATGVSAATVSFLACLSQPYVFSDGTSPADEVAEIERHGGEGERRRFAAEGREAGVERRETEVEVEDSDDEVVVIEERCILGHHIENSEDEEEKEEDKEKEGREPSVLLDWLLWAQAREQQRHLPPGLSLSSSSSSSSSSPAEIRLPGERVWLDLTSNGEVAERVWVDLTDVDLTHVDEEHDGMDSEHSEHSDAGQSSATALVLDGDDDDLLIDRDVIIRSATERGFVSGAKRKRER